MMVVGFLVRSPNRQISLSFSVCGGGRRYKAGDSGPGNQDRPRDVRYGVKHEKLPSGEISPAHDNLGRAQIECRRASGRPIGWDKRLFALYAEMCSIFAHNRRGVTALAPRSKPLLVDMAAGCQL